MDALPFHTSPNYTTLPPTSPSPSSTTRLYVPFVASSEPRSIHVCTVIAVDTGSYRPVPSAPPLPLSLMSALLTPSMRACMPSMHTASSPPLLHHAGRRGLLLCYECGTVAIVSPPSLPPSDHAFLSFRYDRCDGPWTMYLSWRTLSDSLIGRDLNEATDLLVPRAYAVYYRYL